jgi:very-short-patch-repair endonuclease
VNRSNITAKQVIALYKRELSVKAIAETLGTSRGTVVSRLISAGITPRTASEEMYLRMSKLNDEERQRLTNAAHESLRGKKQPLTQKLNRARTAERNQKLSELEGEFVEAFREAGVEVAPIHAVGIYCIDIAIPEAKLAIEIHGGNWHLSTKKQRQDALKLFALSREGWLVIYLWRRDLRGPNFERAVCLAQFLS